MPTDDDKDTLILDRMGKRIRESSQARMGFIMQAERNDAMFMGRILDEDMPLRGHNYFLVNKTGPAVIAHAQVQMESKPRVSISPRESAAEPEYFLKRKALLTIKSLIDKGKIDWKEEGLPVADELGLAVEAPIEEEEQVPVEAEGFRFDMLMTMKDRAAFRVTESFLEHVMPLMGIWPGADGSQNLPALKPTDLIAVDDQTTAKILQNMQDIDWDRDDNDVMLMENVIDCNKFGWSVCVGTWDKEKFIFHVMNTHIKNVYLPPNATNVTNAEYVEVREFLSVHEAKERYPYAAKEIDAFIDAEGTGSPSDSFGQTDDVPFINTLFERAMLYVYHEWNRNVRYPMEEADAVEMGRVVLKDGVYFLTDDEYEITTETTTPGQANWPKRLGIQYVQVIAGKVVLDVECPNADIPVFWNKNIPVSYRPYGQGEPERLWFIQKMIDKLASILIDHLTYYRSPQQIYPWSVYKKLQALNQIHSYPGRDMFLEDGVFERYRDFFQSGKGFTIDPPKLTTGYVELWLAAMKIHDELSGNVQVLQGRSPGSDTSGKALETLQTAARGMIGFKAFQTENMLKQLVRLRLDAHRKFLPLFMWERMNDKYPAEVLAAVRDRAYKMEFDVKITVSSGGGELLRAQKDEVRLDAAAGLASPEFARKVLEYEDDDKTWQNPAMAQAQAPAAAPASKQPPSGAAA